MRTTSIFSPRSSAAGPVGDRSTARSMWPCPPTRVEHGRLGGMRMYSVRAGTCPDPGPLNERTRSVTVDRMTPSIARMPGTRLPAPATIVSVPAGIESAFLTVGPRRRAVVSDASSSSVKGRFPHKATIASTAPVWHAYRTYNRLKMWTYREASAQRHESGMPHASDCGPCVTSAGSACCLPHLVLRPLRLLEGRRPGEGSIRLPLCDLLYERGTRLVQAFRRGGLR